MGRGEGGGVGGRAALKALETVEAGNADRLHQARERERRRERD